MMDTYGRFKLMQSLRSWLEIPTAGVQYVGSVLQGHKEMVINSAEYMETSLAPFGGDLDAIYHNVPLFEIWNPHITQWQQNSIIDDYKDFIAYMRGKL